MLTEKEIQFGGFHPACVKPHASVMKSQECASQSFNAEISNKKAKEISNRKAKEISNRNRQQR